MRFGNVRIDRNRLGDEFNTTLESTRLPGTDPEEMQRVKMLWAYPQDLLIKRLCAAQLALLM
jgi:hypothetical protein